MEADDGLFSVEFGLNLDGVPLFLAKPSRAVGSAGRITFCIGQGQAFYFTNKIRNL
jgi:hypothetical protein